jgi:hypothetical protein
MLDRVPRNDPTDTGGLFIGRRPGTAPLVYRDKPEPADERRRRRDGFLAGVVLVLETVLCLTLWGPQPAARLRVGSQVNYQTGSVSIGIATAFAGMIASLMLTLSLATRMDRWWRLLRRAAGKDQREGMLTLIFAVSAIVAGGAFLLWFFVLNGPAPSFSSPQ